MDFEAHASDILKPQAGKGDVKLWMPSLEAQSHAV